jgi:hypothetical protein
MTQKDAHIFDFKEAAFAYVLMAENQFNEPNFSI